MRVLFGVVAALVLSAASATADDLGSHVRISDGNLRALKDQGAVRSETFRDLLVRLDTTSVLVFVDCEWFLPSGVAAHTAFMTVVDGLRYVRVAISCSLPPRLRLPMLAHELQHALEIGENPAVTDVDSMESYYESAGFEDYYQHIDRSFETSAAIAVQRRVEQELTGKPTKDDRTLPEPQP
jgi:hypothetical protein